MEEINIQTLSKMKHIHLVGIKGVAMTSLAQSLLNMGIHVTGSDVSEDFITKGLLDTLKVSVYIGFNKEHISKDIDLVIYSGANNGSSNIEVTTANDLNIPTIPHAKALGILMEGKQSISVCGVGGKTTTSAILSWIFEEVQLHPSYSVGVGDILNLHKTGTYIKDSEWYIAEADEYAVDPIKDTRPRFIYQHPTITICTNLVFDHPDIYKTFEDTIRVYKAFFGQIQKDGTLIINGDDEVLLKAVHESNTSIVTVGESTTCMYRITNVSMNNKVTKATLVHGDEQIPIELSIPGTYNVKNACYAYVAARTAGVTKETILSSLKSFKGTLRRFEDKGKVNNVQYYDDYAHHPSEIISVLEALKSWEAGKRIVCIFEPHTYSRTKSLLKEFANALVYADEVFLLDIFASAREVKDESITSDMLCDEVVKLGGRCKNLHTVSNASEYVSKHLTPQDVCITVGAGDVFAIHNTLQKRDTSL